jgi:O-antigen biosynthesis protein
VTRLLYVDAKWPTPGSDAASQRSQQMLEHLVALGFEVDFAALFAQEAATDTATPIALGGARPVKSPDEGAVLDHIARHGHDYDVAVLAWTRVASRLAGPLRAVNPGIFICFDTYDVNHVREYRHARVSGNSNLLRRALAMKQAELAVAAASDVTIAISEPDAQVLRGAAPSVRVEVVTLGVEARPTSAGPVPGPDGRSGAIYLGNYYAWHNVDAVTHAVEDVLPELRRQGSRLRLTIAGAGRHEMVDRLAGPDVDVLGYVDDLAATLDRQRLFLGCLRIGSGVKGKLLAAFANGLPVVGTPIALEGIPVTDGRDCLVAESAAEIAAVCIRLETDDELWRTLSVAGQAMVTEHFSRQVVAEQVANLFSPLLDERRPAEPIRSAG